MQEQETQCAICQHFEEEEKRRNQKSKFFICQQCGNIVEFIINNTGVPLFCCGQRMTRLLPNTTDATVEKHVPVITVDVNKVTVDIGSAQHPMLEQHYISWIYIETEKGIQRKTLMPNDKPSVEFVLTDDDKLKTALAYCNLHGLWKADFINK